MMAQNENENRQLQGLDFTWKEVKGAIKENRLLSFDLEFSRLCNLRCLYCYSRTGHLEPREELTLTEIKDIIDQAVALGARNVVNIGGGEPLMYRHYWEVLEKERAVGLK